MENPFEIILEKLNKFEALLSQIKVHYSSTEHSTTAGVQIMNVDQAAAYIFDY